MNKTTRVVLCLFLTFLLAFGTIVTVSGEGLAVSVGPESSNGVTPVWYSVNDNRLIQAGAPVGECVKFKVDPPNRAVV